MVPHPRVEKDRVASHMRKKYERTESNLPHEPQSLILMPIWLKTSPTQVSMPVPV